MSKSKIKQQKKASHPFDFLNRKSNWFIFLLVVLPLLQSPRTIDHNISIRFMFQAIFMAAYVVYFYVLKRDKIVWHFKPIVSVVFISSCLYVLWGAIGGLWSINSAETIYDISRYALNLVLLFLVMQAAAEEDFNWDRIFSALILIGLVHAFIGFDQYFNWGITSYRGAAQPSGAMINRNLFGSFLTMLLPLVFYVSLTTSKNRKIVALVVFYLLIVAIFYSQTRSAWIAGILVFTFSSIVIWVYLKEFRKAFLKHLGLAVALVAVLVLIKVQLAPSPSVEQGKKEKSSTTIEKKMAKMAEQRANESIEERNERWKKLKERWEKRKKEKTSAAAKERSSSGGTIGGFDQRSSESIRERLLVWKQTSELILDHPIKGVGPGNWKIVIPTYKSTEQSRMDYGEINRIRPHNIYLLALAETGIVGFILYFTSWILILIIAFKTFFTETDGNKRLRTILILSALIALASDGFFSFPTERIEHSVLQLALMGAILGTYIQSNIENSKANKAAGMRLLLIPIGVIIGWCIYLANEKYDFENYMRRARLLYTKGRHEEALQEVEKGKSKFVTLEINNDPIELVAALSLNVLKRYNESMEQLTIAEKYNPYSTRILSTKGNVYTAWKKHEEAIAVYKKALELSPRHDVSLKNIAINYYYTKDYAACLASLDKVNIKNNEIFTRLYSDASRKLNQ